MNDTYKVEDLEDLVKAVDYVSMHTYPFTTHIIILNLENTKSSRQLTEKDLTDAAMNRTVLFAETNTMLFKIM
jgi:hypothetical protein